MRYISTLIIIPLILALSTSMVFALPPDDAKPVTPYGDCTACGKYGICKTQMSNEDAKKAMIEYYDKKRLHIKIEKTIGRFIKAKIMDNGKVVDIIIFDCRTGRIRSIY
ncbi:MAG: hypothetical protein HZC48_02210 [Nitrospirae bacterium]|nr:hypothetical protein [Nitrospirota bacterium]